MENVADAIVLAVADPRAAGCIYNVAEADTPTDAEWVQAMATTADWTGEIVVVPKEALPEHLRTKVDTSQHLEVSARRIRDELGHAEAVPREEALRRTVAWERAEPPDPSTIDAKDFDYSAEDTVLDQSKKPPWAV